MKIILIEEVPSLGKVGDLVSVANGYARNFLIPQKLAKVADPKNVRAMEHEKRLISDKLNRVKKEAERLARTIEGVSCTISKQVGEEDKLFGAVTSMDIEESLKKEEIFISRKQILLEEPIKTLGVYTIPVKIHSEVSAKLKVWVVKE